MITMNYHGTTYNHRKTHSHTHASTHTHINSLLLPKKSTILSKMVNTWLSTTGTGTTIFFKRPLFLTDKMWLIVLLFTLIPSHVYSLTHSFISWTLLQVHSLIIVSFVITSRNTFIIYTYRNDRSRFFFKFYEVFKCLSILVFFF